MRVLALMSVLVALSACVPATPPQPKPEWLPGGPPPGPYHLTELNGRPFPWRATLTFGEGGTVSGESPCNQWHGDQTAAIPAFAARNITSTLMACVDDKAMAAERPFLDALAAAQRVTYTPGGLLLTGPKGVRMVFKLDG